MSWWSFKPYVSVAERRANALREMQKLEAKGQKIQPIRLEGKIIARTFWGKAWCDNLESYSDFASRLPRGRTYVRNGSVCDLHIESGCVRARVCGSELYTIKICIKPVVPDVWSAIKRDCGGQIGSVIELLQGKLSQEVMQIITRPGSGLFPKPAEIDLDCSCPDYADMCKHVAAALYGVGARLDEQPELLFLLRKVDHMELIAQAADVERLTRDKPARKTIAAQSLSDVFGIDLERPVDPAPVAKPAKSAKPTKQRQAKPRETTKTTAGRRRAKRAPALAAVSPSPRRAKRKTT